MITAAVLLQRFSQYTWYVSRTIYDVSGKLLNHGSAEASFQNRGQETIYFYQEIGHQYDEQAQYACEYTACYQWVILPDSPLSVRVILMQGQDAGSVFHTLTLASQDGRQQLCGYHRCKHDHYASIYTHDCHTLLTVTHRVIGPQKNYVSQTVYKKK